MKQLRKHKDKRRRAFRLDLGACPKELVPGLAEIRAEYPDRFAKAGAGTTLRFAPAADLAQGGLAVRPSGDGLTVAYGRTGDAFRALGRLLGAPVERFEETARFDMLGVMIDVSRNGVLLPTTAKALIRRFALMGINTLMLYAEDTYEVPGEPFFGYMRGRYTQAEMRDLDDYARKFGVEMFPCIQVLAHLRQVLQWPAYAAHRDTPDVLLADDGKTYRLIEKMIAAASAPFRSKRIHLGMDEALGIGAGVYKTRFGERHPFDILNRHLARVRQICRGFGLKPMIWSDMYFRIGSKTGDYYDEHTVIPPKVAAQIPKDVALVYWDYYHTKQAFYEDWIDRHRALGSEPIMAGGIWTWHRFWAALPYSFAIANACMRACKAKGLRQAFVTMWNDEGSQCDIFSALPAVQYFAEHGFADDPKPEDIRANLYGSSGIVYDDWVKASELDCIPGLFEKPKVYKANTGTWLFWQDPLLGHLDKVIENPAALKKHYARLAAILERAAGKSPLAARLRFPAAFARALALKCGLRAALARAYRSKDRSRQRALLAELSALRRAVKDAWKCHRRLWLENYKPFGLETIERRYGGLLARLESLTERWRDYCGGKLRSIPELEAEPEKIDYGPPGDTMIDHARAASPSAIV